MILGGKTMNKEQLKIRAYGENINRRARETTIEEKHNVVWRIILKDLEIDHIN